MGFNRLFLDLLNCFQEGGFFMLRSPKKEKPFHQRKLNLSMPEMDQEALYGIPYHYLPEITNKGFRQHQYWSWGYRYLGRLQVVYDILKGIEFDSLIDIGCGDGRFLREIRELYPDTKIQGVDISHRAIELAKRMNPGLFFEQRDIIQTPLNSKWSVVTLLEVVEHIPLEKVRDFMSSITEMIVPGGHIIITVPHRNEKMASKHYQHFEPSQLYTLIADDYDKHQFILFDHASLFLKILLKLMGGSGRYYIVTWRKLTDLLFHYYMKRYLYGDSEKTCKKIAYTAQKKNT